MRGATQMTRRKPTPSRVTKAPASGFIRLPTAIDEALASPTKPARTGTYEPFIAAAVRSLGAMTSPATATTEDWAVCCMVGNVVETMLQQGLVQDPDGLLDDAFEALKAAADAAQACECGVPPLLTGAALTTVEHMMTDWAVVLKTAPHRSVIRALRGTAKRVKEIEAGRLQAHDHLAQLQ